MRLVLDTNVVVSALLWGGLPQRLLESTVKNGIELFTSPVLAAELAEILERPQFTGKLREQDISAAAVVSLYLDVACSLSPLTVPRAVPDDADDDHVIACALAASADAVVSGDRDLLRIREFKGVAILTVAQALRVISGPAGQAWEGGSYGG